MLKDAITRRFVAIALFVGLAVSAPTAPAGAVPEVRRYRDFQLPTPGSRPIGITAGPDGNLWFTEQTGNKIGRITPSGTITEFDIPTPESYPIKIAVGPDGNLWFTEYYGNNIGRITTTGTITEFPVTTVASYPSGIAAGPDGNLWFTEIGFTTGKIGRISTTGIITGEFTIPTAYAQPNDIASGPDGNLWFTEATGYNIGRITTAGTITEFAVPFYPLGGITTGPDENLWFTVETNKIGRITTDGLITGVFHTPATNSAPLGITAGPDGNLWFTEINGDRIGRISTAGAGRESPSKSGIAPDGITVGPDGNIWFTELSGNAIAVFRLS